MNFKNKVFTFLFLFTFLVNNFLVSFSFAQETTKPTTKPVTTQNQNKTNKTTDTKKNPTTTKEDDVNKTKDSEEKDSDKTTWDKETKKDTKEVCTIKKVETDCDTINDKECLNWKKVVEEKKCEASKEVELPKEVQELFNKINQKYWPNSSHVVTYNWHEYDNSTIIYWSVAMRELKEWIQWIDNKVKIDYELSKLSKLNLWNAKIDSSTAWYTPWVRSAKSYLTGAFYAKSYKVFSALYSLAWKDDVAKKITELWTKRQSWMSFLAEMWILYAISLQENGAVFWDEKWADKEQIKQHANNGWIFQLVRQCNVYVDYGIENWTKYPRTYIDAVSIWWFWNYLKYPYFKSWNAYDNGCLNLVWDRNKMLATDEAYIKMWKQLEQVDPERAKFLRSWAFAWSSNDAQLYIYMWRELSFMYQFFNISSFYEWKFGGNLTKEGLIWRTYSNSNSFLFVKQFLDLMKPWHTYTKEDWIKDVSTWSDYAKAWYKGNVSFIMQQKIWPDFPSKTLSMRFTSTEHWADFIFSHFSGSIWALYNGVLSSYRTIRWHPYVSKTPQWALQYWYWFPNTCWQYIAQCTEWCASYINTWKFSQAHWMFVQNRSFLAETYWYPVSYEAWKTDWYAIMLKFIHRYNNKNNLWWLHNNVQTSCLTDWTYLY